MSKMVYTEFRAAINTIEKLATDNKAFYNLIRQLANDGYGWIFDTAITFSISLLARAFTPDKFSQGVVEFVEDCISYYVKDTDFGTDDPGYINVTELNGQEIELNGSTFTSAYELFVFLRDHLEEIQ